MSYMLYSTILAFTGFFTLWLGIWGWQHRDRPGLQAFSIFMFLTSVWPLVQAVDVATTDLTLKIFLMKIRLDAPAFAAIVYLVMVAQLTAQTNWITRQRLAILSIVPILGMIFNWISPNALFRYDFHLNLSGPFQILLWNNGPLFYLWSLYATVLFLVPLLFLARVQGNISQLSSRQVSILIVATIIPVIFNVLFLSGVTPISGFNIAPISIVVTSSIIAWGIFYKKAFAIVPVARGKLISSMKDGMVVLDPMNHVVDINPTAQQIIGLKADEALGRSVREVFALWPELISSIKDIQEDQIEIAVEKEKLCYFDLRITSLRDQKGLYLGRMLIIRNITKHKKAEEALIESETRFRSLYENSLDAIILTRPEGIILAANPAAQRMFDMSEEEMIKAGRKGLFIMDKRAEIAIKEITENGKAKAELAYKRKDGSTFPGETTSSLFTDADGTVKTSLIIRDLTEHKKLEEELRKSRDNLELKVQERTAELDVLIDELKRSNEELQQFAYVSSHDLQEPLRTIASFTQLMERRYKGKLDSDADEFMNYIVEAAVRMKQQINDLLEFSRVTTAGKEFKVVDATSLLNKTFKILHALIMESNTEITVDELPNVMGDAGQLERVFQNLISNAIKFRKPEEPLKIHISAHKSEDKEYVFSVKDTGIGIEEPYFDRIFTIFQRLHTRDEYQGTGIGLSIVKRIIERHGGRVWVESEFGVGSTFYFTIPIIS